MGAIAFIGLGNMGGPMAANLIKAGHTVVGFDLVPASREAAAAGGVTIAATATACVDNADVVITMLPAGKHVIAVWDRRAARGEKRRAVHRLLDHRRCQRPQRAWARRRQGPCVA